jgi:hypothetical protein
MRIKLKWPKKLSGKTWVTNSYQYEPSTWQDFSARNVSSRRTTIELLKTQPNSAYCKDVVNLKSFLLELSEDEYINKLHPDFEAELVRKESHADDIRSRKWGSFFELQGRTLCFRDKSNNELDFKLMFPNSFAISLFELQRWVGECRISHWYVETVRFGDINNDNLLGITPGKYLANWGWDSTKITFDSNIAEDSICIESFSGGVLRINSLR